MQAYFDPENNIWEGAPNKSVFNPKAGLGDILLYCLKRNGDTVAQINNDDGIVLTYQQTLFRTIRIAENLKKHGFKEGDVISLASTNNSEVRSILLGCFMAGLPINPLYPHAGAEDYEIMFKITKPKLVFCEKHNWVNVNKALNAIGIKSQVIVIDNDEKSDNLTMSSLLEPVPNEAFYLPSVIANPESKIALIICSSGTTGLPKAVCLSHSQIIAYILRAGNLTQKDVLFSFSSLFWISGVQMFLIPITVGATLIITTQSYSSDLELSIIEKYRVTTILCPPSSIAKLLENPRAKDSDLSSIKIYITGGSTVHDSLATHLKELLPNGRVVTGYGTSEHGSSLTINALQKLGSVGRPFGGAKLSIVDENRKRLGPNEIGEISFQSEFTFLGYMGNPEATNASLDFDGWFYTGDMGYFDDTHHLFIVGRSKEIIKFESHQISPVEIEEFIQKKFKIVEVCAVGIEDFEHGNDLLAVAIVKSKTDQHISEQDIIQAVESGLSDSKRLRGGVYFLESFPLTTTGKLKRNEIKQIVSKLYQEKE